MWFLATITIVALAFILGRAKKGKKQPPALPPDVEPSQPVVVSPQKFSANSSGVTTPTVRMTYSIQLGDTKSGSAELNWLGINGRLTVSQFVIESAMTYTSSGTPRSPEASCIDVKLPVGVPVSEPKGALGYWPQYANISADQRANYLAWLASGRKAPLHDIGYAFLFFYGLERRALIEKQDTGVIIQEVLRLLKTYPESRSFQSYLTSFVAYLVASAGLPKLTESWFRKIFEEELFDAGEAVLSVGLAWLYINNRPLIGNMAYWVAQNDPRCPRSVVLMRLPNEFRTLFLKKFDATYPSGLLLKAAKNERVCQYNRASPSLLYALSDQSRTPVKTPDVWGIQSQFKPLITIWTDCISELKATSTKMAKGLDLSSREAFEALPTELKEQYDHPDKPNWQNLIDQQDRNDGIAIVPISQLAKMRGIDERKKLTLRQSIDLANGARDVGFLLTPDPWTIQRPYAWSEPVAVVPSDPMNKEESVQLFHAAALIMELGIGMAAADGKIEREELIHISLELRKNFRFSQFQARRLEALRELLVKNPSAPSGIAKRIQDILSKEQKEFLGNFLLGVAASNGEITVAEHKALKGLYRSMGLEPEELNKQVQLLSMKSDAPVTVQVGATSVLGEALPARTAIKEDAPITIDMVRVAQLTRETSAVAEMIGKAMGELPETDIEDAEDTSTSSATSVEHPSEVALPDKGAVIEKYKGLATRYHQVLDALLEEEKWERMAFEEIVRRFGFMPSGILEEINSWSDEHLGDYLIEGEGPLHMRRILLEKST